MYLSVDPKALAKKGKLPRSSELGVWVDKGVDGQPGDGAIQASEVTMFQDSVGNSRKNETDMTYLTTRMHTWKGGVQEVVDIIPGSIFSVTREQQHDPSYLIYSSRRFPLTVGP